MKDWDVYGEDGYNKYDVNREGQEREEVEWSKLHPELAPLFEDEAIFVGNEWSEKDKKCIGKIICINLNDTFSYACADGEHVKENDYPEIVQIWKRWGWIGLVCWSAKKRNEDPAIEYTEDSVYQETWVGLYGDLKVDINYMLKNKPDYRWGSGKLDLKPWKEVK